MDNNKELQPQDNLDELTPKNKVFLNLLLEGNPTVEAYKLAGYEGDNHAAYTLKTRLEKHLAEIAQARGMSKADLLNDIKRLSDMDLVHYDKQGNVFKVEGLTVDQYIKLLQLRLKLLPEQEKPNKITAIQINRYGDKAEVKEAEVIKIEQPED